MNGMTPRGSFGGYPDINGYGQQPYYNNGLKPQIYTVSFTSTHRAAAASSVKQALSFDEG